MTIESLIVRFGLPAIGVGAALEGETAVIAGGILAHQHLLSPIGVAAVAAAGSFVADQGFFAFGRHFRDNPRVEHVLEKPAAEKALAALERRPTLFILGFRFLYGLRTASPVAIGTSDVSQTRFVVLNALAAVIWALLFTAIGYALGGPLGHYFHDPKSIIPMIIGAMLIVGIGAFLVRMGWKVARRAR